MEVIDNGAIALDQSLVPSGFLGLLFFVRRPWWRGVDDVNDRPVGNPKRRFDEHSSKFSLSKKPRFINPVGKSQTPEGDAC
jgi:hypothetical protein